MHTLSWKGPDGKACSSEYDTIRVANQDKAAIEANGNTDVNLTIDQSSTDKLIEGFLEDLRETPCSLYWSPVPEVEFECKFGSLANAEAVKEELEKRGFTLRLVEEPEPLVTATQ